MSACGYFRIVRVARLSLDSSSSALQMSDYFSVYFISAWVVVAIALAFGRGCMTSLLPLDTGDPSYTRCSLVALAVAYDRVVYCYLS